MDDLSGHLRESNNWTPPVFTLPEFANSPMGASGHRGVHGINRFERCERLNVLGRGVAGTCECGRSPRQSGYRTDPVSCAGWPILRASRSDVAGNEGWRPTLIVFGNPANISSSLPSRYMETLAIRVRDSIIDAVLLPRSVNWDTIQELGCILYPVSQERRCVDSQHECQPKGKGDGKNH